MLSSATRGMSVFGRMAIQTTFVPSGCWVWKGYVHEPEDGGTGYRVLRINGVMTLGHRWSYEYFRGEIPEGLVIDHLCRVRRCWNPLHLEAVTVEENNVRAGRTNRQVTKTECPQGHEYNQANTYERKYKGRTHRMCRVCGRERNRIRKANMKKNRVSA